MAVLETVLHIDTEFTNMDKYPKLIQLGVVELNTKTCEIVKEFCVFVKPNTKYIVGPWLKKVANIRKSDIDSGIPFRSIYKQLYQSGFKEINKKAIFTWGDKDGKVIRQNAQEVSLTCSLHFSDIQKLFNKFYGYPTKSPTSLKRALELVNIEFEGNAHNALDDARNQANIHIQMIKRAIKDNVSIERLNELKGSKTGKINPLTDKEVDEFLNIILGFLLGILTYYCFN